MTIFKQIQTGLVVFGFIFLVACDKDRPYDQVDNKGDGLGLITKASVSDHMSQQANLVIDRESGQKFSLSESHKIPTKNQYLAVVSTTSIDKDAPVIPYEMGREVRTILSFTKDNLIAYEIPNQFTKTDLNFKPFIKIPIKHKDYKCALDANQKCTQKEVEDTEKTWVNKQYFKPDFEDLELLSPDGMFSTFLNYAINCSKELDSKLVSYKIEKEAINITIEKTMQQSFVCAGFTAIINPSEVTYRLQQNISLVKLDTLSSPDYQAMEYRLAGPNEFGYFRTIYQTRDAANQVCRTCQKEFVSRWNPKKKVIEFHLSEGFAKPENTALRSATYHGISVINEAFKEAGTDMQIKLLDGDSRLIEGDIRKNLIVMVEDPIKRGLLGYGPSITNPMTGEIVHARTVMFPGIMRMTIERAYDEFLQLVQRQEQEKSDVAAGDTPEGASSAVNLPAAEGESLDSASRIARSLGYTKNPSELEISQVQSHLSAKHLHVHDITRPDQGNLGGDDTHIRLLERYFNLHGTDHIELSNDIEELSKRNYYPADLFDTNSAMGKLLKEVIVANGMTPWDALGPIAQETVINKLLPVVWIPTLIHEIGHNLGLRHNFSGSNDKDNFYTQEELAEKGIDREMKYSSIMDYSYSSANELSVMGKYDVAALRFAYAEEMETKEGKIVSINDEVPLTELKTFEFCTDEGVSLNASCNRFDEGTNYTEIVLNTIESYERFYRQRNFKRNRFSFDSTSGDIGYIGRVSRSLNTLRLVFELYELVVKDNEAALEANPSLWETNEFLRDLKQATIISGLFLVEIIKTPDVHCLVANRADGVPAAIVPLRQLSTRDSGCALAEDSLPPQYMMLGEAGKSYNHIRDRRNPLATVDEIDVRGIWIDKRIALETLLSRTTGSGVFDNKPYNFLIVPELQAPIINLLVNLATDKHAGDLVFQTESGGPLVVRDWGYSLFKDKSHTQDIHYHPAVRRFFNLNKGPTQFHSLALAEIKDYAKSGFDRLIGQELFDIFNVYRELPNGEKESDMTVYKISNNKYYAYNNNLVARLVMGKVDAVKKAKILEQLLVPPKDVEDPAAWEEEQTKKIEEVITAKQIDPNAVAPDDAEPIVKLAYEIDSETLNEALRGLLLPVADFYEMILDSL